MGIWSTLTLREQEQEGEEVGDLLGIEDGPDALAASAQGPGRSPRERDGPGEDAAAVAVRPAAAAVVPARGGRLGPAGRALATARERPVGPGAAARRQHQRRVRHVARRREARHRRHGGAGLPRARRVVHRGRLAGAGRPVPGRRLRRSAAGDQSHDDRARVQHVRAGTRPSARRAQGVPAYLYYFSRSRPDSPSGARHSAEVPYVFASVGARHGVGSARAGGRASLRRPCRTTGPRSRRPATPMPTACRHGRATTRRATSLLRLDVPIVAAPAPYVAACEIAEQADQRH